MLLSFLTSKVTRLFKSRRVRKFLHRVRRYIGGSKGSLTFHLHNYLYRVLRNSKKRLLRNIYIREFSRAIGNYSKGYRTARKGVGHAGSYDSFESWGRWPRRQDPRNSFELTPSKSASRAKGGGELHLNRTAYADDLAGCNDDNFVIDLYDESDLPNDLQTSRSRSSSMLNRTVDPYADFREPHFSDSSPNEQQTNESIEYDEDEANESIKNCYLYNGYINASVFKRSDEYKFMKEHMLDSESKNLKINIDNEQTCDSDSSEPGWGKSHSKSLNQMAKRICTQGPMKQKKERRRRYEIYNTETTAKQNLYCSNYLNENFHSSSSVSSISLTSSSASSSASSFDSSVLNSSSDMETASLGSNSISDSADESSA